MMVVDMTRSSYLHRGLIAAIAGLSKRPKYLTCHVTHNCVLKNLRKGAIVLANLERHIKEY